MYKIFWGTISRLCMRLLKYYGMIAQKRGYVLMFHKVGEEGPFNLDTRKFEDLLNRIKNVVRLDDFNESDNGFVCLTFDDVSSSFYKNAYPILKKYNYPFTLFVNLELLDTVDYMSSEELIYLSSDNLCTIGSHGLKHTYFSKYKKDEVLLDMSVSKKELEKITQRNVEMFAFPYGSLFAVGWSNINKTKNIYKCGFSTVSSPILKHSILPSTFLPRINVDNITYSSLPL